MKSALRYLFAGLAVIGVLAVQAQPAPAQATVSAKGFVIYASPTSRKLLQGEAPDLKARANHWRDLLAARGSSYTIVTHPRQLAAVPIGIALILPSAVALDDEEKRLITERMEAGEGLLATGMPGTLDVTGTPVSPAFLEKTFQVSAKATPRGDRGFLITVGDTPLTYTLAPGTRVWVGKEKFATPLLSESGAGYLSDWSRSTGETGLVAFATVGKSRRALMGWTEAAWDGQAADFRKLAEAALDWVEGKPSAWLRTWPWPYRGAVTIGIDSLWKFENAPRAASRLAERGVHGSFHFVSDQVEPNAAIIRDLAKGGQAVGGFGDSTQPFGGKSEREQKVRVERMVDEFHRVLGADFPVAGLRAPQGVTDEGTEKAAASLDYIVDIGRVDSLVPSLSENGHLVLLAASANFAATNTAEMISSALDVAMRKAFVGGYAFVGFDLAGLAQDSPMETALAQSLEGSKALGALWMGSATEVAQWWRERSAIKVTSTWKPADSILDLDVTVAQPLQFGASIQLSPPQGLLPRLEDPPAGVQLQNAGGATALVLTGLPAGTHRLRVRFVP